MENRIRIIMERERMSQQEFAQKLGLSPATLSNIFNGKTRPTNNHVQAIHRAFPNINVSWLLFDEGDMYVDGGAPFSAGDDECQDNAGGEHEGQPSLFTPMVDGYGQGTGADSPLSRGGVTPASADAAGGGVMRKSQSPGSVGARIGREAYVGVGAPDSPHEMTIRTSADNVKIIDNRPRRIKEIRVFYDDGTYESFVPSR